MRYPRLGRQAAVRRIPTNAFGGTVQNRVNGLTALAVFRRMASLKSVQIMAVSRKSIFVILPIVILLIIYVSWILFRYAAR